MKTSIKLKLRPSKARKNEGMVVVYVTRHRVTRTLSTGIRLDYSEWDPVGEKTLIAPCIGEKREKELLDAQKKLMNLRKAFFRETKRLSAQGDFNVNELMYACRAQSEGNTLVRFMHRKIEKLTHSGHVGVARCYVNALRSFMHFRQGRDITLKRLSPSILSHYEAYLLSRGNSANTISCYMRSLRAVFNASVKEGIIPVPKTDSFSKVYTGNARTAKRSLSKADIATIAQAEFPEGKKKTLALSRDLFLFSFYTQGMAYADMIRLSKENICGEYLIYRRQKTGQEISVKLLPRIQKLILRYSTDSKQPYLFPVLSGQGGQENEWREYCNGLSRYNRSLKTLSARLGLSVKLTGYMARHTWATCAASEGVSLSTISRGMGHGSEQTTRIYINTLDNSDVNRANQKVLDFLDNLL